MPDPEPSNVLRALLNLHEAGTGSVESRGDSHNRANEVGDGLEYYVKDLFAGCPGEESAAARADAYAAALSYEGGQATPPDLMVRGGAAVEVKKVESGSGALALNSSYPKRVLKVTDDMVSEKCRSAEDWREKDFVYAVGVVRDGALRDLWFVYGDCYAAPASHYQRIEQAIADGLKAIPGVRFSKTRELGRVNDADPLKLTDLRVRGMWQIQHPSKAFGYLLDGAPRGENLTAHALMRQATYEALPAAERRRCERLSGGALTLRDVQIPDPGDPGEKLGARLVTLAL